METHWIKVKTKLPEKFDNVLLVNEGFVVLGYLGGGNYFYDCSDESNSPIEATHWMPLPEPPKD